MSAPLRSAASTTITPSDMPLMMRLRCGNVPAKGDECGQGRRVRRLLADERAVGDDHFCQLVVFGRIDVHHAAGEDAERSSARLQRPAMRGRVDPAGQAADNRQSGASETGGEALGLPQSIVRAVPRAHDADRQGIGRFDCAADEEQARRIGDFAQGARILGVRLGDDADSLAVAEGNLAFGIDFIAGAADSFHQLWADAFNVAQIARRRRQDRARIAESVQQPSADSRPNAVNQGKTYRVDQFGFGGHGVENLDLRA